MLGDKYIPALRKRMWKTDSFCKIASMGVTSNAQPVQHPMLDKSYTQAERITPMSSKLTK